MATGNFVLEAPPLDESFSVKFPLGLQEPDTPLSMLLNLPDEDLKPVSKERISELFRRSTLSPETLRINRHISLDAQEAIASETRENRDHYAPLLEWTRLPTGSQLEAACNLIFTHLSKRSLQENEIFSGAQLAWHLNELRVGHDLSAYIKKCVKGRKSGQSPSEAVEAALRTVRNVVCQRFPRDLMAIEAIQRDVLFSYGLPVGKYSLFAEQAENLFMPSVLFALDEYGIPIQTAQAMQRILMPADTLDAVLEKFRALPFDDLQISEFEREIVREVRETLFPSLRATRRSRLQ